MQESPSVNSDAGRTGAVYDDPRTRPAVVAALERCGFAVAVLLGPSSKLVPQTRQLSPELVVVDLASAGSRGLGIVADLHEAAPGCSVVLMAPFEGLKEWALSAGGYDLVGKDDLRDLERCLRRLAAELEASEAWALRPQPGVVADLAPNGDREHEADPVVVQVPARAARQGPGDRKPETGATPAIQADETIEDLLDEILGNP